MRRAAAGLALLLLALALSGCGAATPPRTIQVTGTGTVTAVPDRLGFSFAVESRAPTARAALAANARASGRLVARLRAAGIAQRDLQTQSVTVFPQLSGRRIVGYVASTGVTATIRDFDRAGAIVDAAAAAGATSVSGPDLVVSQQDRLYRVALAKAVVDARRKALVLARAADAELGAVQSVSEGSAPVPLASGLQTTARGAVGKIEPGTQEIDATATVSFRLR